MRNADPLAPAVVAPAPRDTQRDLASSRVPLTQTVDVVAPPVSAPQRDVSSIAKLTLPAPAVVAPPPSEVSRDLNSWGSSATGDLRTKPVPPPPTASGEVARKNGAGTLTPQVVPPPASIDGPALREALPSGNRSSARLERRAASAGPRRRQSPLWQRTRQQGNRSRRSARPGFFRSSTDVTPEETLPAPESSSPASREQKLDCRTRPAVALSPCRPAARPKADSAAAVAERASAKAMAPAAGCKEKVQARAEKARDAAPIPTRAAEFRRIPAPAARAAAPAARPPYPEYPCRAAPPPSQLPSFGAPGGDAPS